MKWDRIQAMCVYVFPYHAIVDSFYFKKKMKTSICLISSTGKTSKVRKINDTWPQVWRSLEHILGTSRKWPRPRSVSSSWPSLVCPHTFLGSLSQSGWLWLKYPHYLDSNHHIQSKRNHNVRKRKGSVEGLWKVTNFHSIKLPGIYLSWPAG
jgi:hypothetical protein